MEKENIKKALGISLEEYKRFIAKFDKESDKVAKVFCDIEEQVIRNKDNDLALFMSAFLKNWALTFETHSKQE